MSRKRPKVRSKDDLRRKRQKRQANSLHEALTLVVQKYEVLQPTMVCSLEVVQDLKKVIYGGI